jgi:hypothetical protein
MSNITIKNDTAISSLAKQYGDYLLKNRTNNEHTLNWHIPPSAHVDTVQWNNPENIDEGISGVILFLIELYKQTEDLKYLQVADEAIIDLLSYCRSHPTTNYSLYTGRGGFIYVLIQRYFIDKNPLLIEYCLELIRPCNEEYFHSEFTTEYLYDGKAGTILILLQLYKISRQDFLIDYINQFTESVLKNAWLTPQGMCWKTPYEISLQPSCGFAFGVSGISYVLTRLNQYCNHEGLSFILTETDKYMNSCRVAEFQNWGNFRKGVLTEQMLQYYRNAYIKKDPDLFSPTDDYSWANGATGILVSLLNTSQRNASVPDITLNQNLQSTHLFDGLAGLGLYLLEAEKDNAMLELLINKLSHLHADAPEMINMQGGLIHGSLGVIYFLLKTTGEDTQDENIMAPFLRDLMVSDHLKINLSISLATIRRHMLARYYPRTITFMENNMEAVLWSYLSQSPGSDKVNENVKFVDFIGNKVKASIPATHYERLADLFFLEKENLAHLHRDRRSSFQIYLDALHYQDEIVSVMNQSDEWLMKQSLVLTNELKIIRTKWDWSYLQDFKKMPPKKLQEKYRQNLQEYAKEFLYLLQIFENHEVVEYPVTAITKMLLECFQRPTTVGQAIDKIKSYIRTLPMGVLERQLIPELNHKKVTDVEALVSELNWVILKYMRPLIYRKILLVA